jgi:hypothetical protein
MFFLKKVRNFINYATKNILLIYNFHKNSPGSFGMTHVLRTSEYAGYCKIYSYMYVVHLNRQHYTTYIVNLYVFYNVIRFELKDLEQTENLWTLKNTF